MRPRPITTIRQATPERLTEALRAAGALPTGEVARVQTISSHPSPGGRVARLALEYTGTAPSAACPTLFLKMGYGWGEVGFYRAAARHPDLPVLTCYDADFSPRSERCHLLLEDAHDSHGPASEWPLPPVRDRAEAIVDCLAALHAAWWEHPNLGDGLGGLPYHLTSRAAWNEATAHCEELVSAFVARIGDAVPSDWAAPYRQLLAAMPAIWEGYWRERSEQRQAMTLCHGDMHPGNIFFPKQPGGKVCLVDWQGWHVGAGARDLAYLFSSHWHPRREDVQPFLSRYHQALLTRGVRNYPYDHFLRDYRLAVAFYLFDPPRLYQMGAPTDLWWSIFEHTLTAYRELECEEAVRPFA